MHQFCDAADDHGQVKNAGVVIGSQFDVVFRGKLSGFDECFGAGWGNDIIIFAAVEPCGTGVESMGKSERFDGSCEVADLVCGDADGFEALSDFGGVAFSLEHHIMEVASCKENKDAVEAIIESGGGGGDKAAEACALQADDVCVNKGEFVDGIASAADIGDGLFHAVEDAFGAIGCGGATGAVAWEVNEEGMESLGIESACEDASDGHAAS